MSKLNTKILLVVLIALGAIFALVKYTGNSGRSKTFRTELLAIDTTLVTKLEITEQGQTLIVKKTNGDWEVEVGDGTKPAVRNTVRSTIANLNSIQPSRIVARSKDKWQEYAVDDVGTRVKVYGEKGLLGDIILGKFDMEGQQKFFTYVRLGEEEDVYVADNFVKMSLNTESSDFRNSSIAKVVADSIQSIMFNYPDSAFTLVYNNAGWKASFEGADSTKVTQFVYSLVNVASREFIDMPTSSQVAFTMTLRTKTEGDIVISAGKGQLGWEISSSTNPNEVWVDDQVFSKIFKGPSAFY